MRRAIAELVSRGLLVRRRGVGTTVASQVIHRRDELTSLFDDISRRGQKPTTEVLDFVPDPRTGRRRGLGLPPTPRCSSSSASAWPATPTAVMQNWILPASPISPRARSPRIFVCRVAGLRARRLSLTRRSGHGVRAPRSVASSPWRPATLLTMSRARHDGDGSAVEFGDHCYRYDQYTLTSRSTRADPHPA